MVAMAQTLLDKGYAYLAEGEEGREVLFHVSTMADYGKLSNRRLEDQQAGARVAEVSIPLHRAGIHVWNAIAVEGATALMIKGNAFATNYEGFYTTSLLDAYARGRTSRGHDLSETVKLVLLLGEYMYERYHGRYYAKAQNLARRPDRGDLERGNAQLFPQPVLGLAHSFAPPVRGVADFHAVVVNEQIRRFRGAAFEQEDLNSGVSWLRQRSCR
jgi:hypothetical protein